MSYCRFEGCLDELNSCISDLEGGNVLSPSEKDCADRMVEACEKYLNVYHEWASTPRYEHHIGVCEQTYETNEKGYPEQVDDKEIMGVVLYERPRTSFYRFLCDEFPQLNWEYDDGDDWNDDDDTEYCQYVAYPDPSNQDHHFLASYYRRTPAN